MNYKISVVQLSGDHWVHFATGIQVIVEALTDEQVTEYRRLGWLDDKRNFWQAQEVKG